METRKTLVALLAFGAVFALVTTAQAATIAVNFAIGTNDNNSVNADESAIVGTGATDAGILGAADVGGNRWNHVELAGTVGAPTTFTANTQGGNSIALFDTDGNAGGTMTSSGAFYSQWSDATDGANRGLVGEAGLMQSYLLASSTESVTVNLASTFSATTAYAFFEIGRGGASSDMTRAYGLTVNGASAWTNDTGTTDSDTDNDGLMEWKQATGASQATATANANYAVFTGLSGSTVTFSGLGTASRSVLSGFQIVGTSTIPPLVGGPIAFIDINDARGVPTGPDVNGNYWNSTDTLPDTVALVDTSNTATGWILDQKINPAGAGSGLSGGLNNTVAPPFPYDIPQAYADSLYDNNNAGGKGEFSFSGLDSSSQYELKLFGARPSSAKNATIQFIAGTALGGSTYTLIPGSLMTLLAQPDSSGVLTFTLNTQAGSTADLNLMSIQEMTGSSGAIPEPATTCALALAVSGLGGYVRKRRRN